MPFPSRQIVAASRWLLVLGCGANLAAQYSTPVGTGAAKPKTLRATAVLEWTGELNKPSASRLMPVAVWDGEQYQPAGLYLAQPEPLAFSAGTVYELEHSGDGAGLFEVRTAAQLHGQWIGMGKYEPEPPPPPPKKLKVSKQLPVVAGGKDKPAESGRPKLRRKTDDAESAEGTPGDAGTASKAGSAPAKAGDAGAKADPAAGAPGPTASAPAPAPSAGEDKPTLHRRSDSGGSGSSDGTGSASGGGSGDAKGKAPDVDPDRPTLHKSSGTDDKAAQGAGGAPESDPDRPTLHRARTSAAAAAPASIDPDRPRLRYGVPSEGSESLLPAKLEGAPPQMQQIVGVSDAAVGGEAQSYKYRWATAEDGVKLRAALAAIAARDVLKAPAAAGSKAAAFGPAAAKRAQGRSGAKARPLRAGEAAGATGGGKAGAAGGGPALVDEQFSAYELSFSGGVTAVYTAHTADEGAARVYVTLVAQPDFNGTPQILLEQISHGDRLDETPAMRLVDAVDTDNDRRAELVFELTHGMVAQAQGADARVAMAPVAEREFAIYKVAGGRVSQVFTTGPLP